MKVHVQKDVGKDYTADYTESDDDDEGEAMSDSSEDTKATHHTESDDDEEEAMSDSSEDAKEAHHGATTADSDSKLSFNEDSDVESKVCENNIEDSSDSDVSNNIKCTKCYKVFNFKSNLSAYERKVKYSCEECEDSFCSKSARSAHVKANHGKQDFQCSHCKKEFSTKQNLRRHDQNQSANPCDQCSAVFCNAHALKGHVFSDHTCKKCDICGGKYEYFNLHVENVYGNSSQTK